MTILRGEFFGEMALFSGEPSPVSIAAVDDLQVFVIYSDALTSSQAVPRDSRNHFLGFLFPRLGLH
jgi:CRP-like cAMP-binding protein